MLIDKSDSSNLCCSTADRSPPRTRTSNGLPRRVAVKTPWQHLISEGFFLLLALLPGWVSSYSEFKQEKGYVLFSSCRAQDG